MAQSRAKAVYLCGACGQQAPRWVGRCPGCGEWGTVAEQAAVAPTRARGAALAPVPAITRLADLVDETPERMATGIPELDRVLGGGLVPGSLVLLGGEPGIGKSTLVLQALASLARDARALLVTGEESAVQVRSRSERLRCDCGPVEVLAETRLEAVIAAIEAHAPAVCAIDSVQTLASDMVEGAPGAPSQVRQATVELMRAAKERGVTILLVGQVTKDGGLAGPRTLEHLVDCVLSFEGDDMRAQRVLRATKNRFGSTNETGLFEMRSTGLVSVEDPTRLYLAEAGERVGSCVFPAIEGSRALLVEIQALVGPTEIVPPRRVAIGVDRTRLAQVVAVLSRHAGVRLGDADVFVSVAGGARALDPAADLAMALAITSAHRGVPLAAGTAAFGELGLTGAVRPAGHGMRRLAAAAAHGTEVAVTPPVEVNGEAGSPSPRHVHAIPGVREALEVAFAR
ncbi:DNA repair protein RadA [Miltoncostaea marina]|uniref:DNA repair protein RadA n=1 Tax=Miltoncostaea marina TaxID=2843215 RepID=UPI001C3E7954|nr:DNA repair protein RadA [Miltoncostaea marina]